MRLTADEGVDREIVERLRQDGHEILYVAELDPGISDHEVLELSNTQNALLLTLDKDFGELIFRQKRIHAGVLLIRLEGLSGTAKAEIVASALREHARAMSEAFAVISPGFVRIRQAV